MDGSDFESADGADVSIVSTVELSEMDSLSEEIATAIVEHSEKPCDRIGPLQDRIDADAIDRLFEPREGEDGPAEAHLSFRLDEWHVDVDATGYFQLTRIR